MFSLSQNPALRTNSQEGGHPPPGYVGDSPQFVFRGCWSGENCRLLGLGGRHKQPAQRTSGCIPRYKPLPRDKATRKDIRHNREKGKRQPPPRTQPQRGALTK